MSQNDYFSLTAPAKVNLYLHITGKENNGFHRLDSLVAFSDMGDEISFHPSPDFEFCVNGPFASSLPEQDKGTDNLVVQAAQQIAAITNHPLNIRIDLTKNIPVGAGLGGGSSDAATVIKGLMRHWGTVPDMSIIKPILEKLGSDVPVCYEQKPAYLSGTGLTYDLLQRFPTTPVLLLYPGVPSATIDVYKTYKPDFKDKMNTPNGFNTIDDLLSFLRNTDNDLSSAAQTLTPNIHDCLQVLASVTSVGYSQMSGSGSCSFALFRTIEDCQKAETDLKSLYPNWWVKSTFLQSTK